jgi:hypothetical protein
VPAGAPDAPGTVRLALLPAAPWGRGAAAPIGSTIRLDGAISTRAGKVAFRFWFRVTGSSADGWGGLDDAGRWLVVIILAAAATGITLWLG